MVVGRRYFQDSSVGGGATPRLARGGRAGGMDDFKAWLRSSDFWWDESAIELGASFPSTDGAGPPAPRAGVRGAAILAGAARENRWRRSGGWR